jgi:hypothetical protein
VVNVKGWVMVIGSITAYAAIAGFPWNIAIQSALMLIFGALSSLAWALAGSALQPLLTSPRLALLLLASLYPVFMDA